MDAPNTWIYSPATGASPDTEGLGGKATNLACLAELGLPVPAWYAVTAHAFRYAIQAAGLNQPLDTTLCDAQTDHESLATIRDRITHIPLPAPLQEHVADAHVRLIGESQHVAVRSSALDEDAAGQSFAGLHDSFLYVRGTDNVIDAVRKVWASAYNERAIAYRREHGIPLADIAVAVIVQRMVPAAAAGVIFTTNPVNENVQQVLISAVYGAGEGLVSQGFPADTYTVSKSDRSITTQIEDKHERLLLDEQTGTGLKNYPVPEHARKEAALTNSQVEQLADAAVRIERSYGRPQDIEFAIDPHGKPHYLQTRPITTAREYGPAAGHHLVWDNSNIIESYSGVTSPMTFSFIRRAYTIVYHCFCQVMGVSPSAVKANQRTFENMLGLFRGQVYYNLLNWYRLVRLFPGFDYNKQFMESMMGVQEPVELRGETTPPTLARKYLVELPKLARLIARGGWHFARIRKRVDNFQSNFDRHYERWSAIDFHSCQPHELMALYREMEDNLLWKWQAPIINDFFVMIFYGTLKKLCSDWCGDTQGSLQNDLICGEGGIESTEPTKMLLKLAAIAQADGDLRGLILHRDDEDLVPLIKYDPRFAAFNRLLDEYLDRYGFRCMNELKLEEYSLRDRPQFVYTVLRNYLGLSNLEALDVDVMESREAGIRRNAEERADNAIDAQKCPRLKKPIFRWVLNNARIGVKNRENMRFARTKIYGLLRELIRALGYHFADECLLDHPQDVFYLTLDECWDFIQGTAVTTDLAALAALRKRQFDDYRNDAENAPDDRFDTYGMAYHKNRCRNATPAEQQQHEDGVLRGTGCSPGEVTGPVKVLRTPRDDMKLSGEILVADRTDPGWVPLYPSVSGLLIERGSILSHSAIVAREMGIPTIVGIPTLTVTLTTGQHVTMDGAAGTVHINEAPTRPPDPPTDHPTPSTPTTPSAQNETPSND